MGKAKVGGRDNSQEKLQQENYFTVYFVPWRHNKPTKENTKKN